MANGFKKCNSCLELIEDSKVSYCVSCLESGQICHECIKQWKSNGNDPNICTICRDNKNKLKNLPPELNTSVNRRENNLSRIIPEIGISNNDRELCDTEQNDLSDIVSSFLLFISD